MPYVTLCSSSAAEPLPQPPPPAPFTPHRGRGRVGGGAVRRLKKVAGAYLSPSAPHPSRHEVAQ